MVTDSTYNCQGRCFADEHLGTMRLMIFMISSFLTVARQKHHTKYFMIPLLLTIAKET